MRNEVFVRSDSRGRAVWSFRAVGKAQSRRYCGQLVFGERIWDSFGRAGAESKSLSYAPVRLDYIWRGCLRVPLSGVKILSSASSSTRTPGVVPEASHAYCEADSVI